MYQVLDLLFRSRRQPRRRLPNSDIAAAGRSLAVLAAYLAAITVSHTLAMMAFEGLEVGDAAWLTATTMTTVGYGDLSASTAAGRWSTVILVYAGGVFALGKGAADYFEYRANRRALRTRGLWRWRLKDHVLIVNAPSAGADPYFETLLRQFRETGWGRKRDVLILSTCWPDGLPESLARLGVVHVHGRAASDEKLEDAGAADAAAVVVLASDEKDAASDGTAFDLVHRLVEMGTKGRIAVECVDDRNRDRLRDAGASTVMRPMRGYPEMLVRALIAPGSEAIIEDLFTPRGDECLRYEVPVTGVPWGRLAARLVSAGAGTALAYAGADDGEVVVNPRPDREVFASALFLMVKEGHEPAADTLRQLIREEGDGAA